MPSDIDSLLKKKNEKYIEVIFIPSCLILSYSRDEKNDQSSPYQPAIVRWPCLSTQRIAVICYCSVCQEGIYYIGGKKQRVRKVDRIDKIEKSFLMGQSVVDTSVNGSAYESPVQAYREERRLRQAGAWIILYLLLQAQLGLAW